MKAQAQVNLITNPGFEVALRSTPPYTLDATPTLSQAWFSNHGSPDLYHTALPAGYWPPSSCPSEAASGALPLVPVYDHSAGNAYVGLRCYYPNSAPEEKEQLCQQLAAPLVAGKAYYGEFYTHIAPYSAYGVKYLGMGVSSQPWAYPTSWNPAPALPEHYITNAAAQPLSTQVGWQKIAGAFLATSNAAYVTIGNFMPHLDAQGQPTYQNGPGLANGGISCSPNLPGYFLFDDVGLYQVTEAGNPVSLCGSVTSATLGTAPLPASSGATYSWSPATGLSNASAANPTVSGITSSQTYTLTVTIGSFSYTSSVLVGYCPCDHAYAQNSTATYNPLLNQPAATTTYEIGAPFVTTEIDATLYGGTVVFSGQYHVLGPLRLSNGSFQLMPGTTFFIEPNNAQVKSATCQDFYFNGFSDRKTWIEVNKATLILQGATLTSTCETFWGGLIAGTDSKIYTSSVKTGSRVYRSTIRDASVGIFANTSCLPGSISPQLFLTNTNFTNDYYGVLAVDKAAAVTNEGINGCIFSSNPLTMLAPLQLAGNSAWYTETGLLLHNGDYTDFKIANNTFQYTRVGAEVEGQNLTLGNNYFDHNYAAAIRTGLQFSTTNIAVAGNTILVPAQSLTTPQIDATNPVTGIELLGSSCQAITVSGNNIDGGSNNPAAIGKYQIGSDLHTKCTVYISQENNLKRLDDAIRLSDDTNSGSAGLLIAGNSLQDNQNGIHFATDNQPYFSITPAIECNAINNSGLPVTDNTGLLIDDYFLTPNNQPLVLGSSTQPCGNTFTSVVNPAHNEGANTPLRYYRFNSSQEAFPGGIGGPNPNNAVITTGVNPANACIGRGYGVGVNSARGTQPTAADVADWKDQLSRQQGTPAQLWELEQLLMRYHENNGQWTTLLNFAGTLPTVSQPLFERLSGFLMDQLRRRNLEPLAQAARQQLLTYSGGNPHMVNYVRYYDAVGHLARLRPGILPAAVDSVLLLTTAQAGGAYAEAACQVLHRYYPNVRCEVPAQPTRPARPAAGAAPTATLQAPHPNPASDAATFRYTVPAGTAPVLSIRDMKTGKELLRQPLPAQAASEATVSLHTLPAGFYACALLVEGRPVATQKLALVR